MPKQPFQFSKNEAEQPFSTGFTQHRSHPVLVWESPSHFSITYQVRRMSLWDSVNRLESRTGVTNPSESPRARMRLEGPNSQTKIGREEVCATQLATTMNNSNY